MFLTSEGHFANGAYFKHKLSHPYNYREKVDVSSGNSYLFQSRIIVLMIYVQAVETLGSHKAM
jgi:hypothetical protein